MGPRGHLVQRRFRSASGGRRRIVSIVSVLAVIAATLVAYRTFNAAGQPLIDSRMLNAVLMMVLFSAILGPVLTQRFAPRMLGTTADRATSANVSA